MASHQILEKKKKGKPKHWSLLNKNPYHLSNRTPLSYYDKELAYISWLSKKHLISLVKDLELKLTIQKAIDWNNKSKLKWAVAETAEYAEYDVKRKKVKKPATKKKK